MIATSYPARASRTAAARPIPLADPVTSAAGNAKTFLDFGSFISAVIYFVIFIAVVYFLIVVPYKHVQARRGQVVFGDPAPVKTCPACLSSDLPAAASKCKYCGTEQPATA